MEPWWLWRNSNSSWSTQSVLWSHKKTLQSPSKHSKKDFCHPPFPIYQEKLQSTSSGEPQHPTWPFLTVWYIFWCMGPSTAKCDNFQMSLGSDTPSPILSCEQSETSIIWSCLWSGQDMRWPSVRLHLYTSSTHFQTCQLALGRTGMALCTPTGTFQGDSFWLLSHGKQGALLKITLPSRICHCAF